jgi:anti-sigma-K factor RskA
MSNRAREAGPGGTLAERDERALHAYHDGELRGFARWRFERRLARSPELQRELRGLAELGDLLREQTSQAGAADLWDRIALRLPAENARQAEAQAGVSRPGLGWLPRLGAVTAAVVVAAIAAQQWLATPAHEPLQAGVVRWMDSRGRSVMVVEEGPQSEVTIIWLLDGGPSGAGSGGDRAAS